MDLIVVLANHLGPGQPLLAARTPGNAEVFMAETVQAARRVRYHQQKLVLVWSAMRHYARELRADGWTVHYTGLDDDDHPGRFSAALARCLDAGDYERIVTLEPADFATRDLLCRVARAQGIELVIAEDARHLSTHGEFSRWRGGRQQPRMEHFYREQRRRHGILMEDGKPAGGQWNFDQDNRKRLTDAAREALPERCRFEPDDITTAVIELVAARFQDHPGDAREFAWPVTADDAATLADAFFDRGLGHYGDYQDAMAQGEPTLFHSLLSSALNLGLLDPRALCDRAESAWRDGRAELNAVEGFIRQLLGWREYVRQLWWCGGPDGLRVNALNARRKLPGWYWTGDTSMNCLRQAIGQTLQLGYAHHIQRLMVTGNFALLAGIRPDEVHEWYLAVYVDAWEWVESPNTLGMALWADGGVLGSKPYAASGQYIKRMSDYCANCDYDVRATTGAQACPFNGLYWYFLLRNGERLRDNPRMKMMYRNVDRLDDDERARRWEHGERLLARLGSL